MFKRVAPYIGEYRKYTILAVIFMAVGIVANVAPYFFLYQIIAPLTRGESISAKFILFRVIAVAVCETLFAVLYTQGLVFSHISAYNTLKNLRVSLQGKLERQPLGNIREMGTYYEAAAGMRNPSENDATPLQIRSRYSMLKEEFCPASINTIR